MFRDETVQAKCTLEDIIGAPVYGYRGASFSVEIPLGLRFVIRSRLFSDEELTALPPVQAVEA